MELKSLSAIWTVTVTSLRFLSLLLCLVLQSVLSAFVHHEIQSHPCIVSTKAADIFSNDYFRVQLWRYGYDSDQRSEEITGTKVGKWKQMNALLTLLIFVVVAILKDVSLNDCRHGHHLTGWIAAQKLMKWWSSPAAFWGKGSYGCKRIAAGLRCLGGHFT